MNNENKLVGDRFKRERLKRNLKQDDVGEICRVTGKTISTWERGVPIPSDRIITLWENDFDIFFILTGGHLAPENESKLETIKKEKKFNKTIGCEEKSTRQEKGVLRPFPVESKRAQNLRPEGAGKGLSDSKDAQFDLVSRYDVDVSAGPGVAADQSESEIGRLAFRRDWLRQKGLQKEYLVVVRVRGDSMAPTIRDGALALVDVRQEHAKEDGVYVLILDGHIVAKRLQVDFKGGVFIRSDNPAYREQHLNSDECESLYIIGRVVWAGGEI